LGYTTLVQLYLIASMWRHCIVLMTCALHVCDVTIRFNFLVDRAKRGEIIEGIFHYTLWNDLNPQPTISQPTTSQQQKIPPGKTVEAQTKQVSLANCWFAKKWLKKVKKVNYNKLKLKKYYNSSTYFNLRRFWWNITAKNSNLQDATNPWHKQCGMQQCCTPTHHLDKLWGHMCLL